MTTERKIEVLTQARNILHKQESGEKLTDIDIILAHDCVDMVLDALVYENFQNKRNNV